MQAVAIFLLRFCFYWVGFASPIPRPSAPEGAMAPHIVKPFTVADDIGLSQFRGDYTAPKVFSPNRLFFAVVADRGRLDLNRSESSLRIYLTGDVRRFVTSRDIGRQPTPVWIVSKATCSYGPIITDVRWLPDSSGVAFLAKALSGNDQLWLADIKTRTIHALTPATEHVTGFDIRSRSRYVYSILSSTIHKKVLADSSSPAIVGTGRSLLSLIFPEDSATVALGLDDLSELWAVRNSKPFRIKETSSGRFLPIHTEGIRALSLAPDGRSVITAITVKEVPPEWETLYPSFYADSPYRIKAGVQDPYGFVGQRDVSEYVLVDLLSGKTKPLTNAPMGNAAGWWGLSHADWSADGQSIVLSDTFLPTNAQAETAKQRRPCVAVVDLKSGQLACVEEWKKDTDNGYEKDRGLIYRADFVRGDKRAIEIDYMGLNGPNGSRTYARSQDGTWNASSDSTLEQAKIEISIEQGLNASPVLMAMDRTTKASRVIWDPNPQLKDVQLGEVSILKWKDESGRDWVGGLYKPPDFVKGRMYPLVIQTHGFDDWAFRPSGSYPTAFAAQELAGVGFLVLQVKDCPIRETPEEASCQVRGYEAAVKRLVTDGLVDPTRIGIIGFSRTCYYVMTALTSSTLHFGAASVTDGVMADYLQYLQFGPLDMESLIGSKPFGEGLQEWLKRSPGFNLNKVTSPLLVVGEGPESLLSMWQPYAGLSFQHKPADLILLNTHEHVLTNPAMRLASQGETVDWFRFWLKGEEDPEPARKEQYQRWEKLCDMQIAENPDRPAYCVATKH
jgi:dipeptidyl aminopeptidase/acylaminoacyl peptidase